MFYRKGYKLDFHEERMKGVLKISHFVCSKNKRICMLYDKDQMFRIQGCKNALYEGGVNRMLGLPRGEVFLVPWTEEWEVEFLKEKQLIEDQIREYILAIHHIGSTSIPYLSAKPIIDIAIELKNFENGVKCIARLEHLKYRYRKDVLPERYYFNKGEPRTHQIHMYEKGNKYLIEQLCFRNYLINNKTARIEYEQLKMKLSQVNPNNKHKYADDKTGFVKSVLDKINN